MNKKPPALHVENVSVSYKAFKAIDDISLSIKSGEFMGLIGLNGAGKTTLIKTILNLRPADQGRVEIFGLPNNDKAAKQRIAFLPERFEPSWFMTGMEFLKFATALYNKSAGYKTITADEFRAGAESLALDPSALDKRVHTYSKGMRQKLGLLSTLMTPGELLILDEPMSGLDPRARSHVKDTLINLKKQNKTLLICSHILEDMDEICDRIAILDGKTINFIGTPKAFKDENKSQKLERAFLQFIEKKAAA